MSKESKQLFKKQSFGIRKFGIGVASVIIGATLYTGATHEAHAAENDVKTQGEVATQDVQNEASNQPEQRDVTVKNETPKTEQVNDQKNVESETTTANNTNAEEVQSQNNVQPETNQNMNTESSQDNAVQNEASVNTTQPKVRAAAVEQPVEDAASAEQPVVTTKPIPFEKQTKENPDQPEGYSKVIQKGKDGVMKQTTIGNSVSNDVETPQTPEITEIGTGQLETKTSFNSENKPFEVIKQNNPNSPKGETKIIQKGQNGLQVVTTEQDYVNGKPYGEPRVTTETTKEAVNQIVEVGTKVSPNNPNEPVNSDHKPNGGHIDVNKGGNITSDDIIGKVTTPNYKGQKPIITIDDNKYLPNANSNAGDYNVPVTVKYPDGSISHTFVTVTVHDNQAVPPTNPDHSHDHDGVHDMTQHDNDGSNNTASANDGSGHVEQSSNNNGSNVVNHNDASNDVKDAETTMDNNDSVKEQAIEHVMANKKMSREDVVKHENKAVKKEMNQIKKDKLPDTGGEESTGLIASLFAAVGLGALVVGRKRKSE